MPLMSRKSAVITASICGTLLLIIGITCIVLGAKGYFTFKDVCIGVETFEIKDVQMDSAEGGLTGFLDQFTGGLASQLVPTKATMTIDMILEVNNTNPYDLDYEQSEDGVIEISTEEESEEDLVVGSWQIPDGTLKGKARNEIPVEITTAIDLLSADVVGLAGDLITGQNVIFRVEGAIEGTSWAPGFKGQSSFICIAEVESIYDIGSGTNIKCKHSTKAGKFINKNGEVEIETFDELEDEVDPACMV